MFIITIYYNDLLMLVLKIKLIINNKLKNYLQITFMFLEF